MRVCVIAYYNTLIPYSAPMTMKVKNLPPLLEVLKPTMKYTTGAKMMNLRTQTTGTLMSGHWPKSEDETQGMAADTQTRASATRG